MFRLKLALVLLLVVAAGAVGALHLVGAAEEDLRTELMTEVEGSHLAYQRVKRLRDLQMKDLAAAIARSDVGAYLALLADQRKAMLVVEGDAYRAVPGDPNDDALKETRTAYVKDKHDEFLSSLANDLAKRLERVRGVNAWSDKPRAEAVADFKQTLAVCNSFGVNNCAFRLTYFPLKELVDEIRRDSPYGVRPDLVIITDHKGKGLADVDSPKWSDQEAFGAEHPIVKEVKKGAIMRDILKLNDAYYFATAAPIFESGKFRGSVLVGVEIGSALTNDEGKVLGRLVGYLDNKELIRSGLKPQDAKELRHNLPTRTDPPRIQTLQSPRLIAQFVPLTGNLTNNNIRAVLAVNRAAAASPLGSTRTWIILGAIILFVMGLVVLSWVTHLFFKPFLKIDSGIHEVSHGNTEFNFPVDSSEPMWNSMGHSLNMMVGTLTGRELDEDSYHGDWGEDLMGGDADTTGDPR